MLETIGNTLSVKEAAAYLGLSKSHLDNCRCTGNPDAPPFVRVGKARVRYLKSDLDAWLESRRRVNTLQA